LDKKIWLINRIFYTVLLVWTILLLGAASVIVYDNYGYADSLAKNEAVVSVKKDLAFRYWVASHGGVYVPITKRTPPNPYLAFIKNRDVYTSAGQHLTLMNPAYTLSQMMHDYAKFYGTKGHLTSRILLNPKNKPDKWEEKILKKVDVTRKSYMAKETIDGKEYLRYLKPLVTKKSCLKCHAFQGYRVGDIRGGLSVAIPLKPYYEQACKNSFIGMIVLFIIYTLGVFGIFYGRKKAKEVVANKVKDYEQHIYSLANMIEKRDSYTAGHSQRVAKYSVAIAKEMGYNEEEQELLFRAGMLHDIGKITTPDSILLKPGKLTRLEFEIIKEHVVVSYDLLKNVDIYKDIAEIIRHHHEHYDGSGYPQGLKGAQTPILSQIMMVADSFDAMTTNRVYKKRKDLSVALKELELFSGIQFNPEIVKFACIALRGIDIDQNITQRPQTRIEKERFSYFYKDQLTGAYNEDYLEFVLAYNHIDEFNLRCLYRINLHNFTSYNKEHGWDGGDKLLKEFVKKLDALSDDNFVFRLHGDDFLLFNKKHYDLKSNVSELEKLVAGTAVTLGYKHYDMQYDSIATIEDIEKIL